MFPFIPPAPVFLRQLVYVQPTLTLTLLFPLKKKSRLCTCKCCLRQMNNCLAKLVACQEYVGTILLSFGFDRLKHLVITRLCLPNSHTSSKSFKGNWLVYFFHFIFVWFLREIFYSSSLLTELAFTWSTLVVLEWTFSQSTIVWIKEI